jgi:hypothetical protein
MGKFMTSTGSKKIEQEGTIIGAYAVHAIQVGRDKRYELTHLATGIGLGKVRTMRDAKKLLNYLNEQYSALPKEKLTFGKFPSNKYRSALYSQMVAVCEDWKTNPEANTYWIWKGVEDA